MAASGCASRGFFIASFTTPASEEAKGATSLDKTIDDDDDDVEDDDDDDDDADEVEDDADEVEDDDTASAIAIRYPTAT